MTTRQSRLGGSRERREGNRERKSFVDFTWRRRYRDSWRKLNKDNVRLNSRALPLRRDYVVNQQVS